MAEVTALVTQVRAWIDGPASARTPRTRRTAERVVTQATGELQKAGSAIQAEDYMGAQALLAGTKERLQKAVPAVTGSGRGAIHATSDIGRVIRKRSSALP